MNPNYMRGWGWDYPRETPKEEAARIREEFWAFVQRVVEGVRRLHIKSTGWVTVALRIPVTWLRMVREVLLSLPAAETPTFNRPALPLSRRRTTTRHKHRQIAA